ncbi:MAG TPA: zinc ribbon domain-containing protein [Actinobacteria bacterium]|nr:zinc ribbon domain-containing protein [Actinomycetota bacterium]
MIYTFKCTDCGESTEIEASIKDGPPEAWVCEGDYVFKVNGEEVIQECGGEVERVWEPVNFLCEGDPDEIPLEHRTADVGGGVGADGSLLPTTHAQVMGPSKERARRREKGYQDFIESRRRLFREEGQEGGQMTHQVPIELYHGKIKQTGDKDYWRDPSNLKRHKSCQVS